MALHARSELNLNMSFKDMMVGGSSLPKRAANVGVSSFYGFFKENPFLSGDFRPSKVNGCLAKCD